MTISSVLNCCACYSYSITSSARASSVGGIVEAERLGGLEIDDQFVLGRRLHRQVGGLLALEDAIDIAGRAPVLIDDVRPVGDQAAAGDEVAFVVDRGQPVPGRQRDDQFAMTTLQPLRLSRSGRRSGERAKVSMACSISAASRILIGLTSTRSDDATAWMTANWPVPVPTAGSRRTAMRVTPGAICLSSSSHLPLRPYSKFSEAGDVAARPREALDEADADWIDDRHEHDRHAAGRPLQRCLRSGCREPR